MNTKNIIVSARKKGLCDQWFENFQRDNSLKNLCAKYFEGSDWAMENDFPGLELLRNFKTDEFGLHTDFVGQVSLLSVLNRKAFFGNSKVRLDAKSFSVSEIYIRHNSEVEIFASENAIMIINVLDNAKVTINRNDDAQVTVYVYGDNTRVVEKNININVINSNFK